MKNLFLSLVLVMVSLVANSQTPKYFGLELAEQSVLDSLEIPYLSISERNGVNDFGKIEVDGKKITKFNKFFTNNEFVFSPVKNTPSVKFDSFFRNYKFLTENDKFYVSLFKNYNFDIIGFSIIKLEKSKGKYKTVQIIEYRDNDTNAYGTMVLLGDENNFMKFVI
jgi:hypothetical protein